MVCLDKCIRVQRLLFTGRFHPALLLCTCGHQQQSGAHEDERILTSLQAESHCKQSGAPYHTVQSALEASYTEDLDANYTERCPLCGQRWAHKTQRVELPPVVLLIGIKQWEQVDADDGGVFVRRRASPMTLDERVTVGSATYNLLGVVYHQGQTPTSGHYVAVVRHGVAEEPFYLYNDSRLLAVAPNDLRCDAQLRGAFGLEPFSATALVYERAD